MKLNEWNQMFIKSIEHWEIDDFERWHSDGADYIMDSDNCALCIAYNCVCKCCPIHDNNYICCREYESFENDPCVDTARHMIDTLRYIGQNKIIYEINILKDEYES